MTHKIDVATFSPSRFDPASVRWEETGLQLWESLYHFNAFLVPEDFVECTSSSSSSSETSVVYSGGVQRPRGSSKTPRKANFSAKFSRK